MPRGRPRQRGRKSALAAFTGPFIACWMLRPSAVSDRAPLTLKAFVYLIWHVLWLASSHGSNRRRPPCTICAGRGRNAPECLIQCQGKSIGLRTESVSQSQNIYRVLSTHETRIESTSPVPTPASASPGRRPDTSGRPYRPLGGSVTARGYLLRACTGFSSVPADEKPVRSG